MPPIYKAFYIVYLAISGQMGIYSYLADQANVANGFVSVPLTVGYTDTAATVMASVPAAVNSYVNTAYGFTPVSGEWLFNPIGASSKGFSAPTRSLNTVFQPSTTLDTLGIWSVSIAASLSLSGGQLGSIVMEYADDNGITTNVKTCATVTNGSTGTLTLGLNTVNTQGGVLSCIVPKSKYARLRIVNTTGTPTTSSITAQEVQF